MFGAPQQTSYDVRFVLFRIPVSITPFFWIIGAFLAYRFAFNLQGDNRLDPIAFFAAILAILISILVHEMGHALALRYMCRAYPLIVLHGFGGATMHDRPYGYRSPGRLGRIFISFAGPLAGFLLSAICLGILLYPNTAIEQDGYLAFFLRVMLIIGIYWGILNLMPVYPLDGGQIFREICLLVSRRYGLEVSAGVSAVTAILLAILFFQMGGMGALIMVLLFGFLAWQSIQMLQTRRF